MIPSAFLLSVVLWELFQKARKHRTHRGTRVLSDSQILEGGAADWCKVAPSVFLRSANLSWGRDILHKQPCVNYNDSMIQHKGLVQVCCTALHMVGWLTGAVPGGRCTEVQSAQVVWTVSCKIISLPDTLRVYWPGVPPRRPSEHPVK